MLEIEKFIPKENHYVGLLFSEGYWFIKLIRKQQTTILAPYGFDSPANQPLGAAPVAIAVNSLSGWETPTDSLGRRYLEPPETDIVYQFFTGFAPSTAKIYLNYTEREDRMSLIAPRPMPGNIGFWGGESSPYRDPGPSTELWSVNNLYPYFNAENPGIAGESIIIRASFYMTPFSYKVITDQNKIGKFLTGEERCIIRTMGDPYLPIGAPAWLLSNYKQDLVKPSEV